jgi:hypothetical protein
MDWKGINTLLTEGLKQYNELINLAVWNKKVGGMGAFYRSQHELIAILKNGKEKHQNHIQLGKNGRYRTNVWDYSGIRATSGADVELLNLHPTVKPIAMLHDVLLDASSKNDIVLDCFGGSGSTLLAAERCKRRARLIEINPRYVDVTIWRWEKETGKKAILGVRGSESTLRKSQYKSCFTKDKKFTPIHDLTDEMLEAIIKKYNIEVPKVYEYINRTGCMGCPYGSRSGNTEKELSLINENQKRFVCEYFKESYEVLGINTEVQKQMSIYDVSNSK